MRFWIIILVITCFLVGCSVTQIDSCQLLLSPKEKVNKANLDSIFKEIAKELCLPSDQIVIIPDFLEIQNLKTDHIGLLLGEVMRSNYSQICKGKIIQVEFPKYFKISKEGVISLTRNPQELKTTEHSANNAIIGTYSYTDDVLRVFVRKIDMETGHILKMTSKELPLDKCK